MRISGKDLNVQHDIDPTIYGNNDQILATLDTDSWPIPLTFKIGLASDVLDIENHRITIAVDALHPSDNDESLNVGMEYHLLNLICCYNSCFSIIHERQLCDSNPIHLFKIFLILIFKFHYLSFDLLSTTKKCVDIADVGT